jgi:type II secretion system protein H
MKSYGNRNETRVEAGFSVIELMVVVIIMTAVLAASIPALRSHGESIDLRRAADDVAGTLKMARHRAVAANRPVIVIFDGDAGTFYAFEDSDDDGIYDTGETKSGTYSTSKQVDIAAIGFTNDKVTFNPNGSASESAAVVVVNTKQRALRVDLTAATGLVYVSDVYAYEG